MKKQANAATSTNVNVAQNNTKKQNQTASIQSNANRKALPNNGSSKSKAISAAKTTDNTKTNANTKVSDNTKTNQSECTPRQAAIAVINYGQDSNNKISSVTEGQGGDGYANFSNGDIGATVFTNTDGYTVRLGVISARKNGGTGTAGIYYVTKDGTVHTNN